MKILVCDDYRMEFEKARDAIGDRQTVRELVGEHLRTALGELFEAVAGVVASEAPSAGDIGAMGGVFEDVDLAIIDNNLSALEISGARLTAESLVGYVRGFTGVPCIVSLNKNPDVDFDLRYMIGDYQSHADVALNTSHLSNDVLWAGARLEGQREANEFTPWYWPNLCIWPEQRRRQIQFVVDHLERSVLASLAFSDDALESLSRRAKGALSAQATDGDSLRAVTFLAMFAESCRALPKADRDCLAQAALAGNEAARLVVARLTASDVEKWIRRDVLGPQDVLVDVPHLLSRMPFLLGEGAQDIDEWNALVFATEPVREMEAYGEHLVDTLFDTDGLWLQRPCFWWPALRNNEELSRLFFASESKWADVVFCEDQSLFRPFSDAGHDDEAGSVWEFEAEFEGAWTRRYVAHVRNKQYAPRSRFAW